MKNIFTIEPDAPFLETLARELWQRAEGDGFRLSQNLILLPTRRACRHLGNCFARLARDHGGKPVLLPRMRPLGDIDEDEFSFADEGDFDLPPAMGSLKRLMLLTQQVQRRDPEMSVDQAAQAAEALARFLDQIEIEQCDVSRLPDLVGEQELAEHWQQTVLFLEIVTKNWPSILADHGCRDPAERRNAVLAAQAELWRKQPPNFPVIAAGSTGSIRATAALLDVIASLPQGAVILPGLDRAMDAEAWDALDDTHPQHSMKILLNTMQVAREDVQDWGGKPQSHTPRVTLIREAMRPAALTEAWRELRGKMPVAAVEGLTRLTLDHPQEEAQVIALRLRALLEQPEQTAAFVTADRNLALRVASLLRRWGIEVDDSGGAPLAMLPLGAYLNLVLKAAHPQAGNVDVLALLKHPLAACGQHPAACREKTRAAEIRLRRNAKEDFTWVTPLLQPLAQQWHEKIPLAQHIATHIATAESIAASDSETGAERLWLGEIGDSTTEWLDEWRDSADGFPPLTGKEYAALFASLSATKTMRGMHATHPRLSILGPLEARLIEADLVIMGGMNEGTWPPDAGFDPWMSRPMRKKFGLPAPEFRIGLSAHDFAQLACAKQVMLTRSTRSNGTPTVPSRFLLQIDAVLRAAGLSDDDHDALEPVEEWHKWAHMLDAPAVIKPCERPQPCPPVGLRPTRLSVTEIGTWQRNPYAIYAKHILGLVKLEELDAELDASDRGMMIHAALEKFTTEYPTVLPVDAEARLLAIGREIFASAQNDPRVQAFWWASFTGIAQWFVAHERERRAVGTVPLKAEAKGDMNLDGFTLHGRADRVDRFADGSLSIIDYKTGAVPSKAEMKSGIEPQLALLALIGTTGGFSDIGAAASGSLEYWVLKGGRSGCKADAVTAGIAELMTHAEQGLRELIAVYADPATSYKAVPKQRLQPRFNDYAHVSRLAEWGRTAEEP